MPSGSGAGQLHLCEPGGGVIGPRRHVAGGGANAGAVGPVVVEVQLFGHVGRLERVVEDHRVCGLTPVSFFDTPMKVGGVEAVTCFSLEYRMTSAAEGLEPMRLFLEPVCVIDGSMEMTGYISTPNAGRASTLSIWSTLGLVAAEGRVSSL